MSALTERFDAEYFSYHSISDTRRVRVGRILTKLEDFAGAPEDLTDQSVREWVVALKQSGLEASTVAWHLEAVKPFYRWCWENHLIDADAMMRINSVRPPRGAHKPLPLPYSRRELIKMWRQLDERWPYTTDRSVKRFRNGTSRYVNVRRHAMRVQLDAMIELALCCGLRRREIYHLSIDDCHWDNKYIVVSGKRVDQHDKLREVPYPDSTREAIQRWARLRVLMEPEPGICLWLSATGRPPNVAMTPNRMARVLHTFGDYRWHRFRHTYGTEQLRAGMPIEKLSRIMGHANIQQTLAYAKIAGTDIHEAHERTQEQFQRAVRPAA